jgi:hypothetical protein
MTNKIKINRAPVLTLWGVVVAERLGYNHNEALTFGKALAGLNAQSKGRSLGIYSPAEAELDAEISKKSKEREVGKTLMVELVGRMIPAVQTEQGLRASIKDEEIKPDSVERYLEKKFGTDLAEVQAALETLAQAYPINELKQCTYKLYEQFRPSVPAGVRGWGAAGELDLEHIRKMAEKR